MSGVVDIKSYFALLSTDRERWASMIDYVFVDCDVWWDLLVALQDMRACAEKGGAACSLGEDVKPAVLYWLQHRGFRVERTTVFLK